MRKKWKRVLSGVMAAITILSTVGAGVPTMAAENEDPLAAYPTYDEVKMSLDEDEIVVANDYELEYGAPFDVKDDFTGIEILDSSKVTVKFYEAKNEAQEDFTTNKAGTYQSIYLVEPTSGHPSYRISRNLTVKESVEVVDTEETAESHSGQEEAEELEDDEDADSLEEIETEQPQDIIVASKDEVVLKDADFDMMSDVDICEAAEKLIQEHIVAGDMELEFTGKDLEVFMYYQNILNFGNRYGSRTRETAKSLVVKNADHEAGIWDLPMLEYIASTTTAGRPVHNYVKYIADDEENGWRLAYCTQVSKHFIDSTSYISKTWETNGMYSEISYAIAHGCSVYGDKNDSAYSTGDWLKDYYITQTVIYSILSDYGYDGIPVSALIAISGYQDVYDCSLKMYQDVKANAGKSGYGDKPSYKIEAPSSTKMTLSDNGKYYQSAWYSVDATGDVKSRSITLDGAPDGCEIVYDNKDNLKSRFYVRIPVEKAYQISKETVAFKINASAKFSRPYANIYQSLVADAQNITFLETTTPSETVGSSANISITLDKCKIALKKVDSETGNGVAGAVYGVYADAKCTDLVVTMPTTDASGNTSAEFVMQQNNYYVKEISASANYLISTTVENVTVTAKQTSNVTVKESAAKGEITVKKIDRETNSFIPQGDATMEGAVYGLYAKTDIQHPDGHTGVVYKAGSLVDQKTFGSTGEIRFTNLYFGSYYVKEISSPVGYLLDEISYPVTISYKDMHTAVVVEGTTVTEQVKKQAFEIIKVSTDGSSTETVLVNGAEFTVKLNSEVEKVGWEAAKTFDTLITDGKGYAKSIELPYGTYLVKETKTPEDMNTTKDFYVTVTEDSRTPQTWRAFNDAPFTAYIRLIKKDVDTGAVVLLGGTTFKIKDLKTGKDVSMKVGNKHISTFETDETGMVTTPLQMLPGDYEVYEITAPYGYVVLTEAVPFTVTSKGEYHTDEDGDFVIDVQIENSQQYGNVDIYKHGEMLAGIEKEGGLVEMVKSLITGDERDLTFSYEDRPIAGSKFQIVCDETIYTADHQLNEDGSRKVAEYQGVELVKGAVAAIVTTNDEGKAVVERLPLGAYHVEETEASNGFVLNHEKDSFVFEYAGQDVELVYFSSDYTNERQKTELQLKKSSAKEDIVVEGATYGLYAKEDILLADEVVLVEADTLIETQVTDAKGSIKFEADLPLGQYYVKEITAAPGYLLDENSYDVDFTYQGQEVTTIQVELEVTDEPTITEISKTDIATGEEVVGATLQILDSEGNVVTEWVSKEEKHIVYGLPAGEYVLHEFLAPTENGYVRAEDVNFTITETGEVQSVEMKDDYTKIEITKTDITGEQEVPGAELEILNESGDVIESWTSTTDPYYIEKLPVGTYTLRETSAPMGYVVAEDVEFEVTETAEIQKVMMKNETAKGKVVIHKADKDSKEALEGVEFELRDSTGKVLETMTTDKDGHAESATYEIAEFKDGKMGDLIHYTLVETKAINGYQLDETEYDIVFEYQDDQTAVVEVVKELVNEKTPEVETPKETTSNSTPGSSSESTKTSNPPKTGDTTNIAMWFGIAMAATLSCGGVLLKRRKRK